MNKKFKKRQQKVFGVMLFIFIFTAVMVFFLSLWTSSMLSGNSYEYTYATGFELIILIVFALYFQYWYVFIPLSVLLIWAISDPITKLLDKRRKGNLV